MSGLAIRAWSVLSAAGSDPAALAEPDGGGIRLDRNPGVLFDEPLPYGRTPALVDFDIRARLGRKGTSFLDRATALAVVVADAALRDGLVVDDETRGRIGVVLGTTVGSLQATSDYSRETLVQEKPYLVNPVLFPNTVMNRAAGKVAIQFGLRGVNATVAGGPLSLHHALGYAATMLDRGYADQILVGAVEEYSPHRAWTTHLASEGRLVAGEGAAVFVVERVPVPRADGVPGDNVLGLATGFGWREAAPPALAGCVRRALAGADVRAEEVSLVVTGEPTGSDDEYAQVADVLGHEPERLALSRALGVCDAATGALGLAAVLDRFQRHPAGGTALLTARTDDGGVGAMLVRSRG